ncbi:hypothetical protein Slin15195_G101910 [Septoria linicola]|uniref:Uncharacterized protein n=1 Tax=Septoria linicola TaxID=215465 RepID=A0A9Q9AVW2_9PEZI|nr:hypothetical protein Slin14017_G064910 [Septoria linicola]USW56872.1 hypothetical protein Slin15195_G101910 [Septoria linicola]
MDGKKEVRVTERTISFEPSNNAHETAEQREAREDAEIKLEAGAGSDRSSLDDPDWKPGYMNRFPWLGFGSLVVVLLCAIACVLTLVFAQGKSESEWPEQIAPNVIITVLNSCANLAFGIAISNGIAIAWWRKTLHGSTIEQLNRSWLFSSSVKDVVLGAKYFNFIALAALAAKLTIIDGALLQKSYGTEIRADKPVEVQVLGYANETIPMTGRVAGREFRPALLAKNFNDDLKVWAQGGGLLPNIYTGCDGLCFLGVPGAGFEFDCAAPEQVNIDYGVQLPNATAALSNCTAQADGTFNTTECQQAQQNFSAELFHLTFTAVYDNSEANYSWINMSIVSTNATTTGDTCPGTSTRQICKLRPAIIDYPVRIENFKDSHSVRSMSLGVDPNKQDNSTFKQFDTVKKQQNGFNIISYNDVHEDFVSNGLDTRTRVGGVALGLETYLGGRASMTYGGVNGYALEQTGNAAVYLDNDLGTQQGRLQTSNECGFQYVNPMEEQHLDKKLELLDPEGNYDVPSIVGKINQIMFSLALDISNEDDDKDVVGGTRNRTATLYRDTIHYKIDENYMWGAFATIILCIFCVLPVYWGYWQLGRNVTLGPFEIAAAFRAPNLYHESNKPIDKLIKTEVGGREVKFGAITSGDDAGKIGVAEPEVVSRIHPAATPAAIKRISSMRHSK